MGIVLTEADKDKYRNLDIRLAFFDIDGTIVNAAGRISEPTAFAINNFKGCKRLIALASGRPYFAAKKICAKLQINAPSVFFSGSLIVDPLSGSTLKETPLELNEIEPILKFARAHKLYLEAYTANDFFVENLGHFAEIHSSYMDKMPNQIDLDDLIHSYPILKLVLCADNSKDRAQLDSFLAAQPIALGVGYGAAHPSISFFNCTNKNASRLAALEFILEKVNLSSSQAAAFGDGEADLPFITQVGFGVAMGNAPEAVRNNAPFVTASVEADGVALALGLLPHCADCEHEQK